MANFKIGLDAEFAFKDRKNGRLVNANSLLGGIDTHSQFGTDGCSAIGEIRPKPADHPVEMVENIRKVFQNKVRRAPRVGDVHWVAGANQFGYCLGAHIHIGSNIITTKIAQGRNFSLSQVERARAIEHEAEYKKQFGKAFDSLVLPFATVMGNSSNEKKRRQSYGFLSDVRYQNWGYEYRSCSSFLASPATALSVLTVAWVVANEFLDDTLPAFDELVLNGESFCQQPKDECLRMMKERCKFIMSLPTVENNEQFKKILKVAFNLIKNKVEFEQVTDLKQAWKLRYTETVIERPSVMTFDVAWESDTINNRPVRHS